MSGHDAPKPPPLESLFPSGRARGAAGEAAAADYLEQVRRYVIVERNWKNPDDRREEIDLVARDGAIVIFVEVKTRAEGAKVPGYYAVDQAKRRILRRAARCYLRGLPVKPRTFRFDVVEVGAGGDPAGIRHFPNVPLFLRYERG
jgi:putative endonuclease